MSYRRPTKAEGHERIVELVTRYRPLAAELSTPGSPYTETDARVGFIDGLLEALGWDVRNYAGRTQRATEVVMERAGSDSNGSWGRPDYRLRINGVDCMPVEAKKPSVSLSHEASASVQARSYGWSLSLPAAMLTNFHETVIFDATIAPTSDDHVDVAVIPGCRLGFEEYVTRFDELWERLSYESLADGGLERVYGYERPPRGESPFDHRFLAEFRRWRLILAQDIATQNPSLGAAEVGRRTQRLLNALLFLRVCEDRDIGKYEALLESANSRAVVDAFRAADRTFNAGMFTVLSETTVTDGALLRVVVEMYWPRTQFAFGVLRPDILAGLYEQYLAERVALALDRTASLEEKPELSHAGGVVGTPGFIVEAINRATIDPMIKDGVPDDLTVLDLSCGSGVFLLDTLERLIAAREAEGSPPDLAERGALACRHIFGVDIDGAAVEVTKLSLLLAVLGDADLDPTSARQSLPDLGTNLVVGNSVVDEDFDQLLPDAARDPARRARVAPLNLKGALGAKFPAEGFKAIVGNPPYVRIQTMSEHMPDQLDYLQRSSYESPAANNFDLSLVFVERALGLLARDGRLGYITPHRFTNHLAGSAVRRQLGQRLERLVHFGEQQVFPRRTTYVAILVVGPKTDAAAELELVADVDVWREGQRGQIVDLERGALGAAAWPIATADQSALFDQLKAKAVAKLGDPDWVKVFVGVQTSADKIYFLRLIDGPQTGAVATVSDAAGAVHTIERDLLRPSILDQRIESYDGQPEPDRYVIYPYTLVEQANGKMRAKVLSPDEMRTGYPLAFAYFESHKALLAERDVSPDPGESYWAYGRSQSLTQMDGPKLIVRVLSLSPLYARDNNGLIVPGGGDGGPYYLLRPTPECRYSIEVLQAILSHPAVDAFVASGKKYRGSYASHRKAFLVEVPIPNLTVVERTEIESKVTELQRLTVALKTERDTDVARSCRRRRALLTREVEDILTSAYGLDPELLERTVGGA